MKINKEQCCSVESKYCVLRILRCDRYVGTDVKRKNIFVLIKMRCCSHTSPKVGIDFTENYVENMPCSS